MKLSGGVAKLLRGKSVALNTVIGNNLDDISSHLYQEDLIGKGLFKKVAKGVRGVTTSALSAEVALAVSDIFDRYPERFPKYVTVLEKFDSDLAEEMEQEFESELTYVMNINCSLLCGIHTHFKKTIFSIYVSIK